MNIELKAKQISKRAGMSMGVILAAIFTIAVIAVTMISLAINNMKNVGRESEKAQADALAETAIQDLYDQIHKDMVNTGSYSFALDKVSLSSRVGTSVGNAGSYEARVVSVNRSAQDVSWGAFRYRYNYYHFLVEGTGYSRLGQKSVIQSKFDAQDCWNLVKHGTSGASGLDPTQIYYPQAAMSSNGQIKFISNGNVRSNSSDNSGHIISNGGIVWEPASGSKAPVTRDDVLSIQGQYVVAPSAYDFTISDSGIGNSNGSKNYLSPSPSGSVPPNSVLKTNTNVWFADQSSVDGWSARWKSVAQSSTATNYAGGLNSGSITPRVTDGWKVISTPAYINGDLNISSGDIVRLLPRSSNPVLNVIYVKGKVTNAGALKNLGVKIISEDGYTETGANGYSIDANGSPLPDQTAVLQNAALITTKQDPEAITLSTTSNPVMGLVYSTVGGIKVNAQNMNKSLNGLLVAGGAGANSGIVVDSGNSGNFNLNFEKYATIPATLDVGSLEDIDVTWEPSTIYYYFTPAALKQWVEMKSDGTAGNNRR